MWTDCQIGQITSFLYTLDYLNLYLFLSLNKEGSRPFADESISLILGSMMAALKTEGQFGINHCLILCSVLLLKFRYC